MTAVSEFSFHLNGDESSTSSSSSTNDMTECPLCLLLFPIEKIELHVSACLDGSELEQRKQQEEHDRMLASSLESELRLSTSSSNPRPYSASPYSSPPPAPGLYPYPYPTQSPQQYGAQYYRHPSYPPFLPSAFPISVQSSTGRRGSPSPSPSASSFYPPSPSSPTVIRSGSDYPAVYFTSASPSPSPISSPPPSMVVRSPASTWLKQEAEIALRQADVAFLKKMKQLTTKDLEDVKDIVENHLRAVMR
jgi:hypothetical protein